MAKYVMVGTATIVDLTPFAGSSILSVPSIVEGFDVMGPVADGAWFKTITRANSEHRRPTRVRKRSIDCK